MTTEVTIIILNWNGWETTIECLESLYQIEYPTYNVVLIDNGSDDSSINKIKEFCQGRLKIQSDFFEYSSINKPINIFELNNNELELKNSFSYEFSKLPSNNKLILIKNDKNYGFSEGNNIGIRYSLKNLKSDYILLLNNDTVVDKYFLQELIEVSTINNNIGIMGPTVYFYHSKNQIQSAGATINWKRGNSTLNTKNKRSEFKQFNDVDYVSGCAFFSRTEIFKEIGLLNSNYFAYWEETDFCIRASKRGYKVINVPSSKIWHKVSFSTKKSFYYYYMTRNMFWFMKQHASYYQLSSFIIYFFFYEFWLELFVIIFIEKNGKSLTKLIDGIVIGIFTKN